MPRKTTLFTLGSAAALALAACGSSKPSTTTTVTAATGATIHAGAAALSIPAGALPSDTAVTVREAEPRHGGALRIEIEPKGTILHATAKLSVKIDDKNVKLKMVDDNSAVSSVEVEDRNHHQYKTTITSLHEVEVELEHGAACATACAATEECDDGVCKAHTEDASKKTCDPVCDSGQECDDGACKTHSEVEVEHGGTPGAPTTCTPACATGLECDTTDGVCKAHGGGGGGK